MDNCGPYDNYLIKFKILGGFKLTEVESMLISSDEFAPAPANSLMICSRKEQVLLANKFTKFARMMRFGMESFSEDLGLKELKVKEVIRLYCPADLDKFLIFAEVEPNAGDDTSKKYFRTLVFNWDSLQSANRRIVKISGVLINASNPIFTHFGDRVYLSYEKLATMRRQGEVIPSSSSVIPPPPLSSSSQSVLSPSSGMRLLSPTSEQKSEKSKGLISQARKYISQWLRPRSDTRQLTEMFQEDLYIASEIET